jgi:hypothetical protein
LMGAEWMGIGIAIGKRRFDKMLCT